MNSFIENPYTGKIVLTTIAVLIKFFFGFIFKTEKDYKGLLIIAYYILPIVTIIWMNLDENIENSKLTTSIIGINIALIIFNYLQMRISEQYIIVTKFGEFEKNRIKELNQINKTGAEKIKAIANNQNYILSELSKINDRIINYIYENKK
ncbi:hypothetical protein [Polaribacter atrinae]|uniref:hypothetical protein n=1 Tax=Polaribacter atrinae TaxID=1333662 RepID=UPI002491C643|nr:hypothetical protein [Polaribacter atrinae]